MKFLKTPILFFCICCTLQFVSCRENQAIKPSVAMVLDSMNLYTGKMNDKSLSDTVRLGYANKALQYESLHPNDSVAKKVLKRKITLFQKLKQNDSAIQVSKELLKLALKRNDAAGVSSAFLKIGYFYNEKFQKDSAYYFYKRSNEMSFALKDTAKIGQSLVRIAIIQSEIGDYLGSDISAVQSLEYLQEKDTWYLSAVYNCMAISSKNQKDYKEAIYWYDKAIGISTSELNTLKYVNHKANAYRYLQDYDTAIELLNEILSKESLLENNPKTKARIIDNLAFTKWTADKNRDVLDDLSKAMKMREQEKDLWGLNASYAHLSDYFKEKNPKKSLVYASKMYDIAKKLNSAQDQMEALQKLIELDNFNNSKKYYTTYIHISDSLKNVQNEVQNKYVKIKYDSDLNREENLELKIVNSKKELELEKEKNRNIIGAVSSGAAVIGFIAFGFYKRQKHKQEKQAEVYKTETRIAKKIHDEVANDVVQIMNKIQYTDQTPHQVLDDLEEVYLLTRDISHQNNAIETGEKFTVFLKTMLTSFTSEQSKVILKDIQKVELEKIKPMHQIEIYRVLQELMVNMRKHSEAKLVVLAFKKDQNRMEINYSDNGIGVDMNNFILKGGLENVETRTKAINGAITFETSLGKGFKAFLSFKK